MRDIVYDNYFWQNDLVRLRAWSLDDWEWDYHNNFDTLAMRTGDCEVPFPPTVLQSKDFSEKISNLANVNGRTFFAIETLDGHIVGRVNFYDDDERHGTFEIATLIDKDSRGKGYATAAMKILLKYGFMEKRLNKYCASILEGNIASITMHEKLGCKLEGDCEENIYTNGRYYNELLFGLTKKNYLKIIDSI